MQETTSQQNPILYTQNLKTSGHSYFFDVKTSKNGNKYMTITQTNVKDGQKWRNSVIVFSNDWQEFSQAVTEATEKAR